MLSYTTQRVAAHNLRLFQSFTETRHENINFFAFTKLKCFKIGQWRGEKLSRGEPGADLENFGRGMQV